ncbi:RagB/SusD family nutrient uptake outer membrane protein [Filimonas effusa]|uniref:RagB/SusD family nutrient uptake outer membrane protein n=1 Tax=Filimonas effusa TaxID=2508721 RepID=A0A4V1MAC7_9BACT|nr:RagB/SusD family nutrient uptake outer membrane protein [Filimonas effusa]RXK85416.1 RagB/SusD family nutrient uptake outer membrane protein [Filimonas effusa]
MKNFILSSLFILFLFSSCKKSWLEVVPLGNLVAKTTDDYSKLMNDPAFYLNNYDGGWQEPMLMGDDVAAETQYFINRDIFRVPLFQWKDTIYATPDQVAGALQDHSTRVYTLNKIINEVMNSTEGTEAQKKAIRAEALATRAWTHFNMANYYCKPYNASTASSDPGFWYTTQPDVNQSSFPRGTLQQTYDMIIKDLTEALAAIPRIQPFVTRMSRPAVEGILGKVYLFMGRYNDALPLLNAALEDVTANGQTILYNYNETLAPNGSFMPINNMSGPNSPGQDMNNLKEAVLSKVFNSGFYNKISSYGLVLSARAAALYSPGDFRLLFYTNRNPDFTVNVNGRLRKYGVSYSRYGLQLPELYLLQAECKARLNDLSGAVTAVETLRKNRMPVADATVPAPVAGNQAALIKFIVDERTREFAMEGYRWFDMRRLAADPLFAGESYTHTMYNADGTTATYQLKLPERLVLKIPRNVTDANPDIVNNP